MIQSQPTKTYRLTWDELMSRRCEIASDAVLEVRVYEPEAPAEANLTAEIDPATAIKSGAKKSGANCYGRKRIPASATCMP